MSNKRVGAEKRPVFKRKVPEYPNRTLERAFRTAALGRLCEVCNKRVDHAIYQRHLDECKIMPNGNEGEEGDDIIFCGVFQSTPSQANKPVRRRSLQERKPTAKIPLITKAASLSPSNFAVRVQSISSEDSSGVAEIDGGIDSVPLMEVFTLCLHYLKKLIGQFQSISSSQTQALSQSLKSNKENEQSLSPKVQSDVGMDDEASNDSISFSQQMHQKIEENPVEGSQNAHYSLRILWKIIERVLLCPDHKGNADQAVVFWGNSLRMILKFLSSPVDAQKLFVLLLKRRWGWHLMRDTQKQYRTLVLGDQAKHFSQLCRIGLMEAGSTAEEIPLEDALSFMKAADLAELCTNFRIETTRKTKATQIRELIRFSKQRTFFSVFGEDRKKIVLKKVRSMVGEFFRIETKALHLFSAFFTVYAPTAMDTSLMLEPQYNNEELSSRLIFMVLQRDNGNLSFPIPTQTNQPTNSIISILDTFDELMGYIEAKHFEERIVRFVYRTKPLMEEALKCAEKAKELLEQKFLAENSSKLVFHRSLPSFVRRFTAPWVYVRCVSTGGIEVPQKMRKYEKAVEMLKFLIEHKEIRNFCMSSRGKWYERLALNLEAHLKEPEESLRYCWLGMEDPLVGEADKLNLQNRMLRLHDRLKRSPLQMKLLINLDEPERMEINGTTIAKGLGDGKQVNHFYIPSTSPSGDGRAEINKCNVENVALHHFLRNEGFTHGYHTEGSIWHALFRLFFNDIIFGADFPNIWLSQLQDDPLDLSFSDFYENRKEAIDQRLKEILAADDLSVVLPQSALERAQSNFTQSSRILWHNFPTAYHVSRFVRCCPPPMLHGLFQRLCLDFRARRSGFPDLVVWNEHTSTMAVVEVKGPNDSLSTKQQLWLHFFRNHGVRAVVCHVHAKSDRALS